MYKQKDIIICISSEYHADKLSVNKKYEVLQYNSGMEEIKIIDDRGKETWWFADRFQLDDSPYREGEEVKCIKGTISYKALKVEVLYTVLEYDKRTDEIKIMDSMGGLCWWPSYRFEKLTKDNMTKENLLYIEMQKKYLELTGLKVGDRVKVINTANSYQQGWFCVWHEQLDAFVNQYAYLHGVTDYGLKLSLDKNESGTYNFPYFVVDKSAKELPSPIKLPSGEYDVSFLENGDIQVGCQYISYDFLKKLYDTAKTVVES